MGTNSRSILGTISRSILCDNFMPPGAYKVISWGWILLLFLDNFGDNFMPLGAYQYFPEVKLDFIWFLDNFGDNFQVNFWDNFQVNFGDNFMINFMPLGAYQCFPEVELDFVWFLEHFLLLVFSPELPEPYYCFQQIPKIVKVYEGYRYEI